MVDPRHRCRDELRRATRSFRLGMDAQGNEAFVGFVDALETLLNQPGQDERVAAISPHLSPLIEAQQRGDTLRVADLLEHVIANHV